MEIFVQMIYSGRIEWWRAASDTMHHIAFIQQELGQIGAILTSDASD